MSGSGGTAISQSRIVARARTTPELRATPPDMATRRPSELGSDPPDQGLGARGDGAVETAHDLRHLGAFGDQRDHLALGEDRAHAAQGHLARGSVLEVPSWSTSTSSARAMASRKRPVPAAHLSFMANSTTAPSRSRRIALLSWPPMSTSTSVPGNMARMPRAWQVISVTEACRSSHPVAAVAGGDDRPNVSRLGACSLENLLACARDGLSVPGARGNHRPGHHPLLVVDERRVARKAADVHAKVEHDRSPRLSRLSRGCAAADYHLDEGLHAGFQLALGEVPLVDAVHLQVQHGQTDFLESLLDQPLRAGSLTAAPVTGVDRAVDLVVPGQPLEVLDPVLDRASRVEWRVPARPCPCTDPRDRWDPR